jgi:hypothetical protein
MRVAQEFAAVDPCEAVLVRGLAAWKIPFPAMSGEECQRLKFGPAEGGTGQQQTYDE